MIDLGTLYPEVSGTECRHSGKHKTPGLDATLCKHPDCQKYYVDAAVRLQYATRAIEKAKATREAKEAEKAKKARYHQTKIA